MGLHVLLPWLYNLAVTLSDIRTLPTYQNEMENLEASSQNLRDITDTMTQRLLNEGLAKVAEDVEQLTKNLVIDKGYMRERIDKQ